MKTLLIVGGFVLVVYIVICWLRLKAMEPFNIEQDDK